MNTHSGIIPLYGNPEHVLVKARDCHVFDARGKKYLDFESGVWCANLGHNNPAINIALKRQLGKATHHGYRFGNPEAERLAGNLKEVTRLAGAQSSFLCSGSEAVNLAIRIAMQCTGRGKVLKVDNSYLSAYGYGRLAEDNTKRVEVRFNDIASIDAIDWSEIAAVALELGGASVDTVRFPDQAFVSHLQAKGREAGCVIIANEVTTGFGRTGAWFAYMHYGLTPDIVVTGKGLGNGYPVSAVTINQDIGNRLADQPFRYAQSHQNDPLGCAVANSVIDYFRRHETVHRAAKTGAYFLGRLLSLKNQCEPRIKEIRGKGLMLAMEFTESVDVTKLNASLFDAGFVVGHKAQSLRFMPPLTIAPAGIDQLMDRLEDLLA